MRHLFSGVASAVLVSALMAGPGFAQALSHPSTPAERAETESLNAQTAENSQDQVQPNEAQAPDQNDAAVVASDQSDYDAAQQQYDQDQAHYQAQLRAYDAKNNAYQQQRQNYEDADQDFHAEADAYQGDVTGDHFAERILTAPGDTGPLVRIGRVADPARVIDGMPMQDRLGHVVGHFDHVAVLDDGRTEAIVMLSNRKWIALDEDHLRYKPRDSVVVADLSFDELNRMPAWF